jgi:hypothetical protein
MRHVLTNAELATIHEAGADLVFNDSIADDAYLRCWPSASVVTRGVAENRASAAARTPAGVGMGRKAVSRDPSASGRDDAGSPPPRPAQESSQEPPMGQ